MKAKLVTQPTGKPLGARVISAGKPSASGESKKKSMESNSEKKLPKKRPIKKEESRYGFK